MRLSAFAVLALLYSGCTIHVVEQPASPVGLADAPTPPQFQAWRPRPVVAYTPTPVSGTPAPADWAPTAPPRHGQPPVASSAARPSRIPFKALAPEPRSPSLANSAPPIKHRRPQKVKQDEPVTRVASTRVAKAQ